MRRLGSRLTPVYSPDIWRIFAGVNATANAAGGVPATWTGTSASGERSHCSPRHAEHDDVVERVAVAVPAAQHALAAEADALERDLRAAVAGVRPRGHAVEPEPAERERGDQRLRLAVAPAPPPRRAEPRADRGAAVARGQLGQRR